MALNTLHQTGTIPWGSSFSIFSRTLDIPEIAAQVKFRGRGFQCIERSNAKHAEDVGLDLNARGESAQVYLDSPRLGKDALVRHRLCRMECTHKGVSKKMSY